MSSFKRLVRFASNNQTYYGDLIDTDGGKYTVKKLSGSPFDELKSTEDIVVIDTVRPLDSFLSVVI